MLFIRTESPRFLEFRDPLEPASGFQSVQFRRIEWISRCEEQAAV